MNVDIESVRAKTGSTPTFVGIVRVKSPKKVHVLKASPEGYHRKEVYFFRFRMIMMSTKSVHLHRLE